MKLSEVFRKAAETCHDTAWGWIAATEHDPLAAKYFEGLFLDDGCAYVEFESNNDHRVLALCMAAAIAESEGL